jgi:hypothetical protein
MGRIFRNIFLPAGGTSVDVILPKPKQLENLGDKELKQYGKLKGTCNNGKKYICILEVKY